MSRRGARVIILWKKSKTPLPKLRKICVFCVQQTGCLLFLLVCISRRCCFPFFFLPRAHRASLFLLLFVSTCLLFTLRRGPGGERKLNFCDSIHNSQQRRSFALLPTFAYIISLSDGALFSTRASCIKLDS